MIESRDGVYSVGGTPCRQLIEHAIARGWAKRPKIVIIASVIEKEPKHVPTHGGMTTNVQPLVPIPTPKANASMTLEERAKAAGMTVDQLLDMRMRTKARVEGREGDAE